MRFSLLGVPVSYSIARKCNKKEPRTSLFKPEVLGITCHANKKARDTRERFVLSLAWLLSEIS